MNLLFRHISILVGLFLITGVCVASAEADGISDSQKDQLKTLAANTRQRTIREHESMRRARHDLLQIYSNYPIDERKAKIAHDKINASQLSLLNIHLNNEIALRNLLTSDQFKQFRSMMKRHTGNARPLVVAPPEEDILDRWPDKQMLDSLGVSEANQKRLQPANVKLIAELRSSSRQLLDRYAEYSLDTDNCKKLISNIHSKQVELLKLQYRRQHTIRQVLSVDQFRQLQREIAKSMSKREPRHYRRSR